MLGGCSALLNSGLEASFSSAMICSARSGDIERPQVRVDRFLVEAGGNRIERALAAVLGDDHLDLRFGRVARRERRQDGVGDAAGQEAQQYELGQRPAQRAPHSRDVDIVGGGGIHGPRAAQRRPNRCSKLERCRVSISLSVQRSDTRLAFVNWSNRKVSMRQTNSPGCSPMSIRLATLLTAAAVLLGGCAQSDLRAG